MRCAAIALTLALAVVGGAAGSPGRATRAPVTVKLGEFFFRPKIVTVHVGQPVRFLNVGKIDHTVSDKGAKLIKPRDLPHGASQTVVFRRAGTVAYYCTFHPTLMRGKVVVVP